MGVRAGIAAAVGASALMQAAAATPAAPRCAADQLRVISPQTQGTATQAVAFVSIRDRGVACRLRTTASLTVMQNGVRVQSIRGNPVRYKIVGTFDHGTWTLFDAWWSNWCGERRGFEAQVTVGSLATSASYRVLPACLDAVSPSRLMGVRYTTLYPPVAGP
jgi:hypothetical protein